MKKIFVLAMVLVMVTFTVSAQSADRFTLGARFGADFGINSASGGEGDGSLIGFGLAPYVTYAITDKIAVQAELNFMFNQGMKTGWSQTTDMGYAGAATKVSYDYEASYHSLDIPVLLKYAFIDSPVVFGVLAGPYLSIPLGKGKLDGGITTTVEANGESQSYYTDGSGDYDVDGVKFGITAGLYAGFQIGPGRIVGDLRFLTDFAPIKISSKELFTRHGINLTVGYELPLGGNSSGSSSRGRRR